MSCLVKYTMTPKIQDGMSAYFINNNKKKTKENLSQSLFKNQSQKKKRLEKIKIMGSQKVENI